MQSFIDELAHAAGKDPVQFRLAMLSNTPRRLPRRKALLPADTAFIVRAKRSAECWNRRCKSGWGSRKLSKIPPWAWPPFHHRGHFAEVAEVHLAQATRFAFTKCGWLATRQSDHQPSGA